MGVYIGPLIDKRMLIINDLVGKSLAIDAYNSLYQFLASIRTSDGHNLMTNDGRIISHLKGVFHRTSKMINDGINPIFVFDGKPHSLKKGILEERRLRKDIAQREWEKALKERDLEKARTKAQQTSKLTKEMVNETKKLLDLMGIAYIEAPGEGEAQASYMCMVGDVDYVLSQDYDSLLFGCPRLVRNISITGRRKLPGRKKWIHIDPELINLKSNLKKLGVTREQLVDIAILIGTDFNEGIKGIGPKKAYKLIKKSTNLETLIKDNRIPLLEYNNVRSIFLEPEIIDNYSILTKEPDYQGIIDFLVGECEFNIKSVERILSNFKNNVSQKKQSSLESFY